MLLAALALTAQVTITGHVVDRTGQPVAGATVTLVEARQAVTTRADGSFSFSSVPSGTYTLVARRIGYAPVARQLNLIQSTADVSLTVGDVPFRAEPITVTSMRGAVETFLSPMPVSVLSAERVHREAGISLAKSVSALPGVRDVSTGLQIGKPMVRGLYGPRVLVLHDGSRLEDYSWSEEDGPSIDARLAERVEVIRGPASVLYGSDALSGVVNVLPEELPGPRAPLRGAIEAYTQTNNIELGSAAKLEGALGDRLSWRVAGTGRFAGSYRTPVGEVAHTGFLSANVDGAGAYRGDNHSATLRFSHYGGEFKLLEANGPPAPPAGGAQTEEGPERVLLDDRVQIAGNHLWSGFHLETRAQFQRHALQEKSDECVPPPGQTTCTPPPPGQEAVAFDLLLNTATADVVGHHTLGSRVRGTVGLSGMLQSNDSRGPIFLVPGATINSGALFAMEEISVGDRMRILLGGRGDTRHLSADANTQLQLQDDSRSWTSSTAHAGVVLSATSAFAFVADVGMGWRAPTLFDLYANGPHLAEARFEVGDRTLEPERALNTDVGVRWATGRVRADVTGFVNTVNDFIYLTPTAQTQNGLQVFRHVQSDARLTGAEGLIEVNVTDPLTVRLQHDFVRGEKRGSASGPLPLMPPPRTVLGGQLRSTRLRWARYASLGLEAERVEKQTRLDPNDFPTEGYTLINVDTEIERAVGRRAFRFDFDVRNASNRNYRDFLSRYKQFAPSPGINFILRLSTEL